MLNISGIEIVNTQLFYSQMVQISKAFKIWTENVQKQNNYFFGFRIHTVLDYSGDLKSDF